MARDGDGAVAVGAATSAGAQSRRGVDGEERSTSAGTEQESGCSQHGELGPQSTQDIGVDDGVEGAGPEGQGPSGRRHCSHSTGDVFGTGAEHRQPEPIRWHVGEDDAASGAKGEV